MTARAYPWAALAKTTRADAETLRAMKRAGGELARLDAIADTLSALTKARVSFRLRSLRADKPVHANALAVILSPADEAARAAAVEVEPSLASALVARIVDRAPPAIVDPLRLPGDRLAGAFAALLVAALRKTLADVPLRVIDAGDARTAASRPTPDDPATASFTVLVDDEAFLARVTFSRGALATATVPRFSRTSLVDLGDLPIALPLVACSSIATAREIAELEVGDAWMPGTWPLKKDEGGAWRGPLQLASPANDRAVAATLDANGDLVVGGAIMYQPAKPEGAMDSKESDALTDALGDAPIVVRVEIGAAEMRAREWAALGEGDVIALGRKIAEPVIVRAGSLEIARGELVAIDGEVGVRILSLTRGAR